jgi:hypothetical protein
MIAGLGSLAISNLEAPDPELGHEYNDALREERDLLCEALVMGAKLKALLHPPRRFTRRMLDERLKSRYERLIGLLEGRSDFAGDTAHVEADLKAMKRCEFLVTPVPMPHLFVIGNQVAYEGMKRGGSRGYAMTHCETDLQAVQKIIEDFDMHFAECRELQGNTHAQGNSVAVQLKAFLREAMQAI